MVWTECDDTTLQRHFKKVQKMFAICTHIIVSLLKDCKVWTDATKPHFNVILKRNCSFILKNYKMAKMKGELSWMTKFRD